MKKKKKLKAESFISISAALRAREARMLSDERLEQAVSAQTKEDAAKLLADSGMPDMSDMTAPEIDAALSRYRAEVFDDLSKYAECVPIVDLFRLKYDYHNVKVLVKAMAENTDGGAMLSRCGRVDPDRLTDAFNRGVRGDLPAPLADAMGEAVGVMSRTKNPQLADIGADAAWFREYLSLAEGIGCTAITDHAKLQIDATNLKTAVRMLRMGRGWEHLEPALVPGGTRDVRAFAALSASGEELTELFTGTPLQGCALLGRDCVSGGSLTAFEKSVDDALTASLGGISLKAFGPEVVFGYLCGVENAVASARMIMNGKLFGIGPESLRERMRSSYV